MKKYLAVLLPLIFGLLMVSAVLAATNSLSMQETDLTPKPLGEALEVNPGSDGLIYVSDYGARQIWRVNPANTQVDIYTFTLNVSDAKPDAAGDIWFVDGDTTFARLDPNSNQGAYWDVPLGHYLGSLTFDSVGRLWIAEYFGTNSKIYSFDPASTELCTYTLPLDGSLSDYILYQNDQLWFANYQLRLIYNLDISQNPVQATWWQIPNAASRPVGIALDNSGRLWWADSGLGALATLDPATGDMTRYNLPYSARPKMLSLHNNAVWYTAWYSPTSAVAPGSFGALFPQQASGITTNLTPNGGLVSSQCHIWGAGASLYVDHTATTLNWNPVELITLDTSNAWLAYQLPADSDPWGIAFANSELWMVDQGRQKLMRAPLGSNIFLPIVLR